MHANEMTENPTGYGIGGLFRRKLDCAGCVKPF
jgi:hypothetical protein